MKRRERKEEGVLLESGVDCHARAAAQKRERGKLDAHRGGSPIIEISDADYRSLHLPCDALAEHSDSKPRR